MRGYHLPEAIIAVPLHPKRLRKRGFNQSQLISKAIGQSFSLDVLSSCVQRTKLTGEQTSLNRKQRFSNMKNAFEVCKTIEINGESVKHVAIVDDVITSGSTCNELAKTLKSTGVTIVDVWCIAKTPFIK
jgi:ComF family protein